MERIDREAVAGAALLPCYLVLTFGWWLNGLNFQVAPIAAVFSSVFVTIFSVWLFTDRRNFIVASSIGAAVAISVIACKIIDGFLIFGPEGIYGSERVLIDFTAFMLAMSVSLVVMIGVNIFFNSLARELAWAFTPKNCS